MHTSSIRPCTARDQHTLQFAVALTNFADHNPDFATELALAITAANWPTNTPPVQRTSTYLQPANPDHATQLAHYLYNTITPRTHPHTISHLAVWAKRHDLPQDAVIGIVGIAIMGPTLGILDKPKKKKRAQLTLILSDDLWRTATPNELVQLTHTLSQRVLSTELRLAGGNAYHLHPDTAEWHFEAGPITLYHAALPTLETFAATLAAEALPHQTQRTDADAITAIAVSPCVADEIVTDFAITAINT